MKVYGFTKKAVGIMEIDNTLEALQDFVGGHIEAVTLSKHLVMICNDEGKIGQYVNHLSFANNTIM